MIGGRFRYRYVQLARLSLLVPVLLVPVLFVAQVAASAPAVTQVSAVRASIANASVRVVFDLSAAIKYEVTQLDDPRRIVVEIHDAAVAPSVDVSHLQFKGTPVSAVREQRQADGTVRFVFELRVPATRKQFVLQPMAGHGHRLVLDVAPAPPGSEAASIVVSKPTLAASTQSSTSSAPTPSAVVAAPVSASGPSATPAPVQVSKITPPASNTPPANVGNTPAHANTQIRTEPLPNGGPIVFAIDAGHGGQDPGALGPEGVREKDVVLATAKRLAELFNAEPGFKAFLTRNGDYFIPLRERTRIARSAGAHFFVSVHADAHINASARGASVYALSERGATSETAKWLAERENSSDLIGGVSLDDKDRLLAGVLLDLSMTASLSESLEMGSHVLGELRELTRLHSPRVEQAGFMVLKSPDIPSILIETGYVSNVDDARNLTSEEYRDKLAHAIFRGLSEQARARPPQGTAIAARLRQRMSGAEKAARTVAADAAPPAAAPKTADANSSTVVSEKGDGTREYKVEPGDTLEGIAARFGVAARHIKRLNEMRTNRVRVGQTLRIPASESTASASES